jgi:hypothetical protein
MEVGRVQDLKTMLKYCYTIKKRNQDAVNKLGEILRKDTAKVIPMQQYNGKKQVDIIPLFP